MIFIVVTQSLNILDIQKGGSGSHVPPQVAAHTHNRASCIIIYSASYNLKSLVFYTSRIITAISMALIIWLKINTLFLQFQSKTFPPTEPSKEYFLSNFETHKIHEA